MILGHIGIDRFLREYWQQRPVLLRQALPHFRDPLTPEELAGLACETDVDARIVFTRPRTWELKPGPFKVRDFTSLPDSKWTLLVQAVDQWVPGVRDLLNTVPFLPRWRVDDVMISYATPKGGVGPHFDYYDVFLVQGQGKRLWKTGQRCTRADSLRNDSGLKLLKHFETEAEYVMEPGDVLYVPPGIAHWGTSIDNSLCYSIGFRAPSLSEAALGLAEALSETLSEDQRYLDPKRPQPLRAGEITAKDLQQARHQLQAVLSDEEALARWFGSHMTEPRNPDLIVAAAGKRLLAASKVYLHPASRLAWRLLGNQLQAFVDGEASLLPASKALISGLEALSCGDTAPYRAFATSQAGRRWIQQCLERGSLQRA